MSQAGKKIIILFCRQGNWECPEPAAYGAVLEDLFPRFPQKHLGLPSEQPSTGLSGMQEVPEG